MKTAMLKTLKWDLALTAISPDSKANSLIKLSNYCGCKWSFQIHGKNPICVTKRGVYPTHDGECRN